jgi:hypothetical protein
LLYWQLLQAETPSEERWQTVWDRLLEAELQRGHTATYQACLYLRFMLAGSKENQHKAIIALLL